MDNFGRKILGTLMQLNGCAIGSINTETEVDLLGGKKNPMKGHVTKRCEGGNVMFFTNSNSSAYGDMVKRRLAKEGKNPDSFMLGKRAWGQRLPQTPFVEYNGQYYLEAIFLNAPKTVEYFLDGAPIAKEDIIGLKEDTEEGKQGGLEDKVIIRSYKLSSIKSIKMGDLSVLPE